jgi:hypothetical protein
MTYKFDKYRFNVETSVMEVLEPILFNKNGTVIDAPLSSIQTMYTIDINNVINSEFFRIDATTKELKGLADFIYETIGEKK